MVRGNYGRRWWHSDASQLMLMDRCQQHDTFVEVPRLGWAGLAWASRSAGLGKQVGRK